MKINKINHIPFNGKVYNFGVKDTHTYIANNMVVHNCYEGCTKEGKHGKLFDYQFINTLHPYTEMALNGNDMDHPQLEEFLKFLKTKKVFANITVHQNQFMQNFDLIKRLSSAKLVYGIGVSYNHYSEEFISKIKEVPNVVLHTINGLLTKDDIEHLKGHDLKVLVLGYKHLNRGKDYAVTNSDIIAENQKYLYNALPEIAKKGNNSFKAFSFDNLAIAQLNVRRLLTEEEWNEFYMGDDGNFTFYIDMVKGEFAKNSISQERYPIGDKSITKCLIQFVIEIPPLLSKTVNFVPFQNKEK